MLNNEHLINLLKQKLEQTYKVCWPCYDWQHKGLKPLVCILEDIKLNIIKRKWLKEIIRFLKSKLATD